jgi:DNA-binding MarR family transcriptional regulator
MTAPQERKAVRDWVADHGIATEIESVLQKLEVGEPHVESPMFLDVSKTVRILPRVTADLSSTPKVGTSKAATRPLTPIDVEQLKSAMAETIEKAAADDPRLLRRRILELEKQLKSGGMSSTHTPGKVVEKPVLKDAQLTKIDALILRTEKAFDRATKPVEELRSGLKTLIDAVRLVRQPAPAARQVVQPSARHIPARPRAEAADRPSRTTSTASSNGSLGSGERATLIAAAQYPEGLTREQATILTGYKRSTRDAYIQRLQAKGYVEARAGDVYVTQAGIAALGSDFEPLPTGEDLQAYWLRRLPEGERAVLEAALRSYPESVDRESLSDSTGYKRSTRDAYIQRLSARKLVVPGHGVVKASDHLFGT